MSIVVKKIIRHYWAKIMKRARTLLYHRKLVAFHIILEFRPHISNLLGIFLKNMSCGTHYILHQMDIRQPKYPSFLFIPAEYLDKGHHLWLT